MTIAVIGAGYVGLVTATGLAKLGHTVRVGEANEARLEMLRSGRVPIYEVGLPELLAEVSDRMSFHGDNTEAVDGAEFVFLALPTPEGPDGRADLSFIHAVVDELAGVVAPDTLFVVKSTVPPGTAASLSKRLADRGSAGRVVSHPEFLREGRAVEDVLDPDRIVVGAYDAADAARVTALYDGLDTEVVVTDPTSAEMIKYASNSYLAARLTFVNTLSNLCEAVGADIVDVIKGMGLDHRIGPHFLQPGPGYGGSCFPKDTIALIGVAEDAGYDFGLLRAVIEADDEQRRRIAEKVRQAAGGGSAADGSPCGASPSRRDRRHQGIAGAAHRRVAQQEGAEVVAFDPRRRPIGWRWLRRRSMLLPAPTSSGGHCGPTSQGRPLRGPEGDEGPSGGGCLEPPRPGRGPHRRVRLLGSGQARRLALSEQVLVDRLVPGPGAPSPGGRSSPRTSAAGIPDAFPMTRSAAPAISSATCHPVTSSSRPAQSVVPLRSRMAGIPEMPMATSVRPRRQGRPKVSEMITARAVSNSRSRRILMRCAERSGSSGSRIIVPGSALDRSMPALAQMNPCLVSAMIRFPRRRTIDTASLSTSFFLNSSSSPSMARTAPSAFETILWVTTTTSPARGSNCRRGGMRRAATSSPFSTLPMPWRAWISRVTGPPTHGRSAQPLPGR